MPVSEAKLERLDLNLMLMLHVLLEERNVTRAAARMSVGQPAMSASLSRLRRLLSDDLLVRRGRGMVRTPVAEGLAEQVAVALAGMQRAIVERRTFDPATSNATFSILASDHVALVLLHPLTRRLEAQARHVRLQVRPILPDFGERLRTGTADLAILPREIAAHTEGLRGSTAFVDDYVYVADRANRDARQARTWPDFARLPHLGDGSEYPPAAAGRLQDVTNQRFLLSAYLVVGTGLVALVPQRLATDLAQRIDIAILPPPTPLRPTTETMYWSARTEDDAAHRWLREQLLDVARTLR
jgi:DNA-binding transcriptional LysR family regulator